MSSVAAMDSPVSAHPAHDAPQSGGRKKNSWLAHVKATMRGHRNKSFKQVLKIAKKTYKKKSKFQGKSRSRRNYQNQNQNQNQDQDQNQNQNQDQNQNQNQNQDQNQNQNQDQNGGKRRKGKKSQNGGGGVGGGKEGMSHFAENAAPVA